MVGPQQQPSSAIGATERRYLTVAFSDLIDFTGLSERLDPEDLHDVQVRYQNLAREIVERYGGFVSRLSGDGILIYFGYPIAHENDAERAVRASLELAQSLQKLDLGVPGEPDLRLRVRLGLDSGLVLIGPEVASGGILEHAAVGQTVNLASRLQALAPPNSVLVSKETLELVEGLFDSVSLGMINIKGLSKPVAVHRVIGPRPNLRRGSARFRRGATRMVGREGIVDLIKSCWSDVQTNHRRHILSVTGEAGLGKTRLVMEFCHQAKIANTSLLQLNCHELFSTAPLYAVTVTLRAIAGVTSDDDDDARTVKLESFLEEFGVRSAENLETIGSLFGTPAAPRAQEALPPGIKRRQFDLLLTLLRKAAERGPLVLWIEDAHWLDPSSAELVADLAASVAAFPILFLVTARPSPGAAPLQANETIRLEPLSASQCLELAHSVPGGTALPDEMLGKAVALADGNPLFVEQLTLSLIEDNGAPAHVGTKREALPMTLAELMSERLDRLPGGRRIVQISACLGRSFTLKTLIPLLEGLHQDYSRALDELVKADIFRIQEGTGEPSYEFRHALLQKAAYDSMVQSERRAAHARIAAALASGDTDGVVPEVRAYHLTEAGQFDEAVRAWLQAGMNAGRRSAYVEAVTHLERGLELLVHIPDSPARDQLETGLQAALIGPLTATAGPTSHKMLECCQRGLQLCKQAGTPNPLVFAFLFGQFSHATCRGNGPLAASSAELFQSVALKVGYESGQVIGHRMLGNIHLSRGDHANAIRELEASLKLYSAERDAAATHVFGQNTQVHSRSLLSLSLMHAGRIDEALRVGIEALTSIDELRHPHSSALALGYVGGWVFGLCGAAAPQMDAARRLVSLAEHHRLQNFRMFGQAFIGWSLCQSGDLSQGIAILEEAVHDLEAVEFWLSLPGHIAVLADAMRLAGRLSDAALLCTRALKFATVNERLHEPELKRIQALIAHDKQRGADKQVCQMLRDAVEVAHELGLTLSEYRALQTMRACLGDQGLDTGARRRLERLSHLRDFEERAARLIASTYPSTSN